NLVKGDMVYFLNGGDEFFSNHSIARIIADIDGYDCLAYRTLQYFGVDAYIRPSLAKIDLLSRWPAHQGFVVRNELIQEKNSRFFDAPYAIGSDATWMRD